MSDPIPEADAPALRIWLEEGRVWAEEQLARFVPAASKSERRSEVLEEASRLVDELERAW